MDQRPFTGIKSAKDAHYQRSRNHGQTRRMLRHRNDRMSVISSRGYGCREHVTSKQTCPSMRKRRYSIDVTTVDGWGLQSRTDSPDTGDNEAQSVPERLCRNLPAEYNPNEHQEREVLGQHEELEPVALQRENIPLPNPLRYAPLILPRVLHPPHNEETYLALEESSLENQYFNYILDHTGDEAWMDDSILNMALECLRQRHNCSKYGIDIINTNLVQSIRMFYAMNDTQGSDSDFIRTRFQDKRWIFIPVNNGMDKENYEEGRSGTHWYLVVFDRLHKVTLYYDSQGMNPLRAHLGFNISKGLLSILGEDVRAWSWLNQDYSPCQEQHNQSIEDLGPCGPFVFKMCDYMISEITWTRDEGHEDAFNPHLTREFASWFGGIFNSEFVRRDMQWLIAHHRCLEDSRRVMEEHDRVHGGSS